jgi:hypothetical protein
MPMLLEYCEKFLISAKNSPYSLMELLELSDHYNLVQLKVVWSTASHPGLRLKA